MFNGEQLLVTVTVASGPGADIPSPDVWVRVHSWMLEVGDVTRRAGNFWVVSWEQAQSRDGELDSVELTHLGNAVRSLGILERTPDVGPRGDDYDWPSWLTLGCWSQGEGGMLHVKAGSRGFGGKDGPAFTRLVRVVRDVCSVESDALAWM